TGVSPVAPSLTLPAPRARREVFLSSGLECPYDKGMGTLSNQPGAPRPSRARYGVLGFACSLALLTYLDRICIMQAKESIRLDLGFSDKEMGLIFAAFMIGYLLLEVPGGWMGDRWGSRRVLAVIVLAWSLF